MRTAFWFNNQRVSVPFSRFLNVDIIKKQVFVVKKNLNAAKPPEQSKGLDDKISCKDKTLHGIKRVPQCYHIRSTKISGRSPPLFKEKSERT